MKKNKETENISRVTLLLWQSGMKTLLRCGCKAATKEEALAIVNAVYDKDFTEKDILNCEIKTFGTQAKLF
jgi:hypothetical protein